MVYKIIEKQDKDIKDFYGKTIKEVIFFYLWGIREDIRNFYVAFLDQVKLYLC